MVVGPRAAPTCQIDHSWSGFLGIAHFWLAGGEVSKLLDKLSGVLPGEAGSVKYCGQSSGINDLMSRNNHLRKSSIPSQHDMASLSALDIEPCPL